MDVDADGQHDPCCEAAVDSGPIVDVDVEAPVQKTKVHDPTVDIQVIMAQSMKQDLGPWFFTVHIAALHNNKTIGTCDAVLIKRECITYRQRSAKTFLEAMRREAEDLTIVFHSPPMLHPKHGRVIPVCLRLIKDFFRSEDYKDYRASRGKDVQGKDLRMHPANRAWFLIFQKIEVEERYRRRGVAGGMVRKALAHVWPLAEQADRPLFVAVKPSSVDDFSLDIWRHKPLSIVYKSRIAERFWRSLGFLRYKGPRFRLNWSWLF